ncbi:hypothetical protein KR222_006578 [Zaprionus bogoriensis]|nr:hypothetical protein KR222_006578 [Zaprionus bogoriensis]
MPRRKTLMKTRKYLIIFFGVLFIFIWLNHDTANAQEDNDNNDKFFPTSTLESISIESDTLDLSRILSRNFRNRMLLTGQFGPGNELVQTMETRKTETPPWELDLSDKLFKQTSKPMRYFVNSEKCKMPFVEPFSREILDIYKPFKLKHCSNSSDLFQLDYKSSAAQYTLRLSTATLGNLSARSGDMVNCDYRHVTYGINEKKEHYAK